MVRCIQEWCVAAVFRPWFIVLTCLSFCGVGGEVSFLLIGIEKPQHLIHPLPDPHQYSEKWYSGISELSLPLPHPHWSVWEIRGGDKQLFMWTIMPQWLIFYWVGGGNGGGSKRWRLKIKFLRKRKGRHDSIGVVIIVNFVFVFVLLNSWCELCIETNLAKGAGVAVW